MLTKRVKTGRRQCQLVRGLSGPTSKFRSRLVLLFYSHIARHVRLDLWCIYDVGERNHGRNLLMLANRSATAVQSY